MANCVETYKDSGIEWIGKIPQSWNLTRLKQHYEFEKGKNAALYTNEYIGLNEGEYPVYSGQTENDGIMGSVNTYDYDEAICVFTTTVGAKVMTPKILSGKFCLSQNCLIMKKNGSVDERFLYYQLLPLFDYEKSLIPSYMQPSLRIADLKRYVVIDCKEQQAIAAYLDRKCGEIDKIVETETAVIEKLKEYKQSIITEAVTKGLDKSVPLKDSGIEWIGKIPASWGIGRIKYNYYLKGRIGWQGLKADEFIDEGAYLITGTDFCNGRVNWDTCYHISEERYNEAPEIHVKTDDLLITKDGTVGKIAYIDDKPEKVSLNSHLLIIRPNQNEYKNKFLYWVIQSEVFEKYYQLSQNGTIMASLSQEKISNFSFALPKPDEQIEIAEYLDKKCGEIDKAIADKEKLIEKFTEYKKSLIYECVTGKKEVA